MFDIQTKKKLYTNNSAHEAPVPDISMFESQDVFVSCGYDAKINVYDLRRCAMVQQHKQSHPLSSVCVSSCGTFCVAGNLKGDCIAYDFRNMSEALAVRRIHDSKVVRVAFVPSLTAGLSTMHDSVISANSNETVASLYKSAHASSLSSSAAILQASCSVPNRLSTRNSYAKSIEMETPKPRTCDSWSELMQAPKMHDFSMDSVMQTPSQWSFMSTDTQSNWQQSRFIPNQSVVSSNGVGGGSNYDSVTSTSNRKERSSSSSLPIESKRRRMTEAHTELEEIAEEGSQIDGTTDDFMAKKRPCNVNHADFAAGFADYIKKQFDDNDNDVDMVSARVDDPIKQQVALTDDGEYLHFGLDCFLFKFSFIDFFVFSFSFLLQIKKTVKIIISRMHRVKCHCCCNIRQIAMQTMQNTRKVK